MVVGRGSIADGGPATKYFNQSTVLIGFGYKVVDGIQEGFITFAHGPGESFLREHDRHGRQVSSILDAISQTRLQPAELAGSPVAVNLVWLLAQTTVKPKSRS